MALEQFAVVVMAMAKKHKLYERTVERRRRKKKRKAADAVAKKSLP